MHKLTEKDHVLIDEARKAIRRNYDSTRRLHTVGAAVLCASGNIYTGVNLYSLHGACAEQIALGTAITHGEREFTAIVAVRGETGEEIIPPCGNCRQLLCDYMPDIGVILKIDGKTGKMAAHELLPHAYRFGD